MVDFVVYSNCCQSNWQLVLGDGDYCLVCSKCGKMIGIAFEIAGPEVEGLDGFCEDCERRFNIHAKRYSSDNFPEAANG